MDYSPPGFSVHEIFQARILEWVAIPSPEENNEIGKKKTKTHHNLKSKILKAIRAKRNYIESNKGKVKVKLFVRKYQNQRW